MSKYVIQGTKDNQTFYADIMKFNDGTVIPMWYSLPDHGFYFDSMEKAQEIEHQLAEGHVKGYELSIIQVEYPSLVKIVDDYGEIEDPNKFDLMDFTHHIENALENKFDVTILTTDDWPKRDIISIVMCQVLGKNLTKFDVKVATLDVYEAEDITVIATKKEV